MLKPYGKPYQPTNEDLNKGLNELLAEIEEAEGNYNEAAKHYLTAAKFHANFDGREEIIRRLQQKSTRCMESAYLGL